MRISKSNFSAEVHLVPTSQFVPAFRYVLYQHVDGANTLLFESNLFQEKRNCVANADDHLEKVISEHSPKGRVLCSAA